MVPVDRHQKEAEGMNDFKAWPKGTKEMVEKAEANTLSDKLPDEIMRCCELLAAYREIGPPGAWAAGNQEKEIRATLQAMISGDLVAMIKGYKELKEAQ